VADFRVIGDVSATLQSVLDPPLVALGASARLHVEIERAPMALMLKYLITPWSGDAVTDHRILGRAMQVLYDNAVLADAQLQGGLAATRDTLKVTITPLTMEERTRVWYAVQRTYRLSAAYEIRVANLDSRRVETRVPVREYRRESGLRLPPVRR
jgi:hypothetical protein